jgi:predicted alpha/beta superfamily hydrolase
LPGSSDYLTLLQSEFLPLIEGQYRVDSSQRTIVGASFGGLLVTHAFLDSASSGLFKNFIATDASYGYMAQEYALLQDTALADVSEYDVNLYLYGATAGGNDYFVDLYHQQLQALEIDGLNISYVHEQVRHTEAGLPAFEVALDLMFGE